uniref:Reverse transcriptase domain-containing protein n=1 Tax=Tanacetum cinerariifolium TaxID=118510 RepID=A0A6L2KAE0_TANCI|nr:reverse transcriptase domain-containing protein [Tanacetum cinerariifolium]
MADQRTMAELLRAPIEAYAEAIMVSPILTEHFELKYSLINMMTSNQFFGLEKDNHHDHMRWFNKITSTIKYKDVPNSAIKLILFPFSLAGATHIGSKKNPRVVFSLGKILFLNSSMNLPQERQISEMKFLTFNNGLMNRFMRHGIDTKISFVHALIMYLTADGNTFSELWDNFQGYVSAAAVNYNQGNFSYRPPGVANQIRPLGFAQPDVQNNQNRFSQPQGYNRGNNFNQDSSYQAQIQQNQVVSLSELEKIKKMNEINIKAMQTQINNVKNNGLVLDGPSVPIPLPFINPEEDERVEETLTDPELGKFTIKVPHPIVQKAKSPSQRNYVVYQRDPLHPNIPYPSRMHRQKQQDKDEIQIHKFWQMFKQHHINITLADALILIPKYQKMLKALLSNKEKLLELANIPLNENCSVVILKKLPEKLRDPEKFLIPCGFNELKCKALADLANRAICTPARIARDVFVLVGKFTFPADFVIVNYERDPRVSLILGRPFLWTARALIDIHGEEMILRDGDERLTLNMRHDTSSYSNQPQKESINMINIFNDLCEDYLEDFFATNHLSGNLTFSSHTDLTSPEVKDDIFDLEGDIVLIENLLNLYSTKELPPPHNINPLSGSTTSSSIDNLLEEFADELALITFPSGNDDLSSDIEFDLREIEYLLNHDPTKEMHSILEDSVDFANPNVDLFDTIPEMFTDEYTLDYSSPPLYDDYDDDLFKFESDNDNVYNDPFDPEEEKIKESKLLIDELDPFRSSDFLPSLEYDSFLFEDFSEVDALPSTNNEDKVFNPGILIQENLSRVTVQVTPDKNVKKITISNASLILKDFNPLFSDHELPFHKEVPGSETLLSFSFENEEKVFTPRILTSKEVHTSLLPELSHRGLKTLKSLNFLKARWRFFLALLERTSVIVMRDFNEVREAGERYGTNFNERQADMFSSFITDLNLIDVFLGGFRFTWTDKWASKMSKLWFRRDFMICFLFSKILKGFMIWLRENDNIIEIKVDQNIVTREELIDRAASMKIVGEIDRKEALAQKAKIKWAIKGDENTSFFHDVVMENLRFGSKWHKWIAGCMSNSRASILVNGSPKAEFEIFKGLRQGDPLSPFLFIVSMEGLHAITYKDVNIGMFKGASIGEGNLDISHLFYDDDAIFVGKDYAQNVKNQSKTRQYQHKIGSLQQKPNQRAVFSKKSSQEAKNVKSIKVQGPFLPIVQGFNQEKAKPKVSRVQSINSAKYDRGASSAKV